MKAWRIAKRLIGWACCAGVWLTAACENVPVYEVELTGEITTSQGPITRGRLHVRVYHAESGQGALAHPLGGPITTWTFQNKGTFTEKVGVPTQQGRGLVVYAWLDEDEDDTFCAVGKSPELSGIVELKEFPKHQISFQLALSATCAGPEALYP